jgi:hypothetical protein
VTRIGRRGALVVAAGAPVAVAGWAAASARAASDVERLERLLSIERGLESTYDAAIRRGALEPRLAERLRDHEREHARGLERVLADRDRRPVATVPRPGLGPALAAGERAFARHALTLESEAVAAYLDAFATLRDTSLLQPLGSIVACEGQHLVALRRVAGAELLPRAFEAGAHGIVE